MQRFQFIKKKHPYRNLLISVLLISALLFLLSGGVSTLSDTSLREQKTTLELALDESALHYYSLHGYYPQRLDDLITQYRIIYDSERFYIDYQPSGMNLMPEITVITRSISKAGGTLY